MFCSNCGHEIQPDDYYCPNCGASIADQIAASSVPTDNEETAQSSIMDLESLFVASTVSDDNGSKKTPKSASAKRIRAKAHDGVGKLYKDSVGLEGVVVKETSVYRYVISLKEYRDSWCSFERLAKDLGGEKPQPYGFSGEHTANHNPAPEELADFPAFKHTGKGWFVPAIDELKLFTIAEDFSEADRKAVNKTLLGNGGDPLQEPGSPVFYWSSTESQSDPLTAKYVSLLSKTVGERSKYSKMSVRLFVKVRK